jgi:hypothetical protein
MTREPPSEYLERSGWRFVFPEPALGGQSRERLVEVVLDAVSGRRGEPLRRSRHATSYRLEFAGEPLASNIQIVFLKVLDAPSGAAGLLKRAWRGTVVGHLVRVVASLRRKGIDAPRVLLAGYDRRAGRELVAIEGLPGRLVSYYVDRRSNTERATRREILRALGREIARLHRLGYIHGDLTPYNVLVTSVSPPRFGFIDHERTRRRRVLAVERHRMRNLVQLGRFDIPGLSRTDRVRVLAAYADEMGLERRRALRLVSRMLQARLNRDQVRMDSKFASGAVMEERRAGGS